MAEQTERSFLKQKNLFLRSRTPRITITGGDLEKAGADGREASYSRDIAVGRCDPPERGHAEWSMLVVYQRQAHPALATPFSKLSAKGKKPGKAGTRFWKNVGLGFKTPREAIEGTYIDKKCPFTGNVSIRGRILMGNVYCTKMTRTIVVRRDYLHFVPKYQRYEKRHSNVSAHVSPAFRVKEGDRVIIGQCRPLSKTVRFNVLKVIPAGAASTKKVFAAI